MPGFTTNLPLTVSRSSQMKRPAKDGGERKMAVDYTGSYGSVDTEMPSPLTEAKQSGLQSVGAPSAAGLGKVSSWLLAVLLVVLLLLLLLLQTLICCCCCYRSCR